MKEFCPIAGEKKLGIAIEGFVSRKFVSKGIRHCVPSSPKRVFVVSFQLEESLVKAVVFFPIAIAIVPFRRISSDFVKGL